MLREEAKDLTSTYTVDEIVKDSVKARSIVAMLFWEWRRLETEGITEEAFAAKVCFYKAYVLLKEKEMTREEAKALLGRTALLMFEHNGSSTLDGDKTLHIIDKIFDEHGEQLQNKDDEIELLKHRIEEAMKPKTCEKCKNFEFDQEFNDGYGQCFFGIHFPNNQSISYHKFDDGYCSLFEPKEK